MKAMAEGGPHRNLFCSICLGEFKTPKVLICGHSFCCQCLSKMVNKCSYICCPKCRREVGLPQSGRVEDFTTNFDLMNFVADQSPGQNRIKTEQPGDAVCLEHYCPQHKYPMKFYCKTCKVQVCAECLLGDHEPEKHIIVAASKMAANLSDQLQKLTAKFHYHDEQDKKAIGDKINTAIQYCQQDKQRLKDVIQQTLQREVQKLQEAAAKMLNVIDREAEARTHEYANLQQQLSYLENCSCFIQEKYTALNQKLQQLDLPQAGELEQLDKNIEGFKDYIGSLKTTCQSTPIDVGLFITSARCELGIALCEISNKPMILQAAEFTNETNSNSGSTTGGHLGGSILNTLRPPLFFPEPSMSYQPQPHISN